MPETIDAPVSTEQHSSAASTPVSAPPAPSEPGAWRSSLPEEFRASPSLSKFNDIPALAKAYVEADKALLAPKLPMPQSTWTDKEYGELYGKLGRPDKPDGYDFKPLENLPEGLKATPEQDKWFAEKAHKLGLSTVQANALRNEFVTYQASQVQGRLEQGKASAAQQEAEITKLKTEYGPKWSAAVDGAKRVVAEFGGKEVQTFLDDTELGNDPRVVRMMVKIGQAMMDHSVITGSPRLGGTFNGGPAAAQSELARMESDPEIRNILTKASHPRHDEMVKRRSELQRAMVPIDKE